MNILKTIFIFLIVIAVTLLITLRSDRGNQFIYDSLVDGTLINCSDLIKNKKISNRPVYIIYHVCPIGNNWKAIVHSQIHQIISSGLYDICTALYWGCSCPNCSSMLSKEFAYYEKIKPLSKLQSQQNTWENATVNQLLSFSKTLSQDSDILYIHSKGITGKSEAQSGWRNYMMFWMVQNHQLCRSFLNQGFFTVGCLYTRIFLYPRHYSGNFFWASSKYLATLPYITNLEQRYNAETTLFKNYTAGKHINIGTDSGIGLYVPYTKYKTGPYQKAPIIAKQINYSDIKCRKI